MSDIVNIKVYENTPEGMQAAIAEAENRLDQKIDDALLDSTAIGDPTIPIPVDVTGNAHCLGVGPGTYANWGGLTVPTNNTATLKRVGGEFSVSLTAIDLSFKVNVSDIIDEIDSHEANKPASANSVRIVAERSVQLAKSDSDILIPDISYTNVLKSPVLHAIITSTNSNNDFLTPLELGATYRFKFKVLNNTGGLISTYLSALLHTPENLYVYIWTNKELFVGTQYEEIITVTQAFTYIHFYCSGFGGDIEMSFEKQTILNSGMSIKFNKILSPLKNKSIVWFGTSIPKGQNIPVTVEDYTGVNTYPSMVGFKTGATVYNEAVGGTRISTGLPSAYNADTDSMGIGNNLQTSFGFYSALTHTLAEKDWIFDNWGTIYTKFSDAGGLTSTCPKTKEQLRDYSFERKLVSKYLKSTATVANPNLYIINHDLNDMFKIWMDGGDTIPTANSATERMYYAGAVNFLIRKIYAADAKAQIIMITHYRKNEPDLDKMFDLVTAVAKYWSIPLIDLANNLQTARQIQTAGYWDADFIWHDTGYTFVNNGDGTFTTNDFGPQRNWDLATYLTYALPHQVIAGEDISFVYPVGTWVRTEHQLNVFCPDNVHPYADLTGKATMKIAKLLSNEIKKYL